MSLNNFAYYQLVSSSMQDMILSRVWRALIMGTLLLWINRNGWLVF